MPDWIGTDGSGTADRYREMAVTQLRGVSPSYEALCLGVADDPGLLAALETLAGPKRQPNLLLAAVRYLDGPVGSWPSFREFALDRWADVAAVMRERRTQTNEPGRCATLLPVLCALRQPLALLEAGASAGLCLYPDRYAYRYAYRYADRCGATGPPAPPHGDVAQVRELGDSPVVLRCAVAGPAPLPTALPTVSWRAGLDLHPLDVRSADDVRWLESLIWPEQSGRFDTLHNAVRIAKADPPDLVAGDLTADLAAVAAGAPADATLVIFHSAVLAYVDGAGRAAFVDAVRAVAADRRTVWVSNEAPGVVAGTAEGGGEAGATARFVLAVDGAPVARTGPHGQTLEWLAEAPWR